MHVLLRLLALCLPALAAAATVSADRFGFDPVDATAALQAAFDDPADTVLVPKMDSAWITGPLHLTRNGKTIILAPGVELVAKAGYGEGDCLISADGCEDLTIRGYGATLRMPKAEYTSGEWRHCLAIRACRRVSIAGLTLRDSGGDGLYLDGDGSHGSYAEDITVRDCVMDNNRRQGVSIISAEKVLLEGCRMINTTGTPPAAGIDFEPDHPSQRLVDLTLRRCLLAGNTGCEVLMYPRQLGAGSQPISVRIEECLLTDRVGHSASIALKSGPDVAPDGTRLTMSNCLIEGTKGPAVAISSSVATCRVDISGCVMRDNGFGEIPSWNNAIMLTDEPEWPIRRHGGIAFVDNLVVFDQPRPFLRVSEDASSEGCAAVSGRITAVNRHGATADFGAKATAITLAIDALATLPPQQVALEVIAAEAVEGGADARIRVRRNTADSFPCAVRLDFAGTAGNGTDYGFQPGFAIIPAGSSEVELAIAAVSDDLSEGSEPFSVSIISRPGDYQGEGSVALTVVDRSTNRPPTIRAVRATPERLELP